MTMRNILQQLDYIDELEKLNNDYMDEFYHPYNLTFSDLDIKMSELEEERQRRKEKQQKAKRRAEEEKLALPAFDLKRKINL